MTSLRAVLDESLAASTYYADPYPIYARLRSESPVHWHGSGRFWLVSRYEDVETVFRDVRHFSSYGFQNKYMESMRSELREAAPTLELRGRAPSLITSDPPEHTRLRRLLQSAFSPRVIAGLQPHVEGVVDELLSSVAGETTIDFVEALAYPLPAIMIAEILGVPRQDRDRFKSISGKVTRFFARANPNAELTVEFTRDADRSLAEFRSYLRALIEARRRHPKDDVVSILVQTDAEGDTLVEEEILNNLVLFLMAGHETTTNLLSSALFLLLRHSEQLSTIRADRTSLPGAIEEVLRFESPVQRIRRVVAEDTRLRGVALAAGDPIEVLVGSANRDEAVFERADHFDIGREPRPSLAFGKGAHFCIGAMLARLEAQVALSTVLDRFTDIRLRDRWTPSWWEVTNVRSLTTLPIDLEAGVTSS